MTEADWMTEPSAAERFLIALLQDGEPWDEHTQGLYESIKAGHINCGETGRLLSMTEVGRRYVESRPDLVRGLKAVDFLMTIFRARRS